MLATLLVTLREGIEAFLIVAITLVYLRKTNRIALSPAVYWGTGVAVVLSVIAGIFFGEAKNKPMWEGLLASAAAIMVLSMVVYMLKASKRMRCDIAANDQTIRVSVPPDQAISPGSEVMMLFAPLAAIALE